MKNVLVTGATGFVGRHALAPLTLRFDEVHAVSRTPHERDPAGVRWHRVDLFREDEVEAVLSAIRATHLLHFAWSVPPGSFWTSPENDRWAAAGAALFESFLLAGGRRIAAAGSCAEYDWSQGLCSEATTPLDPTTLYGAAKNRLRASLEALARRSGTSAAWGRIFFLYGPGERPERLVASVARSLLKGEEAKTGPGTLARDFLYVEDVALAFVSLLDSKVEGPVNVGSGTPTTVAEIAGLIARRVGREDLLRIGARPAGEEEPPLVVADVTRLEREVLWCPRYTLESGLDHTIVWWKHALGPA